MINPLLLLALGGGALALMSNKGNAASSNVITGSFVVKGKSGKSWRVNTRMDGQTMIADVWATAGSFGPHQDIPVMTYTQHGADLSTKKFKEAPANVPSAILTTARVDFGV